MSVFAEAGASKAEVGTCPNINVEELAKNRRIGVAVAFVEINEE